MTRDDTADRPRRHVLGLFIAVGTGLVGCAGTGPGGDSDPDSTPGTDDTTQTDTDTDTDDETGTNTDTDTDATDTDDPDLDAGTDETATGEESGDLDLREANVTGVEFTPSDDGDRFSVTLHHDDDGEDGYANWWQVETVDGDRLGRRDLLHAHGTREFTRSSTVTVPDGVRTVVVRGHDQTHGYGGQTMLVDLEAGTTEAVRQGPEPQSFADRG